MEYTYIEHIYKDYFIYVESDRDQKDPRSGENCTTMICCHRRYQIGDLHSYKLTESTVKGWETLKEEILKAEDVAAICPIYLYERKDRRISISFAPYQDYWKSYQVGWAYITKAKLDRINEEVTGGDTDPYFILATEVIEYDRFLTGELTLKCDIENVNGDVIHTQAGWTDVKDAVESAQREIDSHYQEEK